jgi:hypothetical protein
MDSRHILSRRHLLAVSAAAGALAMGTRFAAAQAAKGIERLGPALDAIIDASEPIVDLATNLGGTANVEGPLWWKEGGYLLFRGTDLKRWKYAPGQPISVFKENTNAANGITRDPQGRLVACEAATRRVAREERDGTMTVVASSFQGRRLTFPNDIVVKSDGAIYFTDPWTGPAANVPPGEFDLTSPASIASRPTSARSRSWSTTSSHRMGSRSRPTRACSTSTTRRAAISAPSTSRRTARSRARPIASLPISAALSRARPTA